MIRRTPQGIYRSEELEGFSWLEHGFGTRHGAGNVPAHEIATLKQIHSDICLTLGEGTHGDALLASRPGEIVGIRTADCVPVLIADSVRRVAAAAHAGWRGTAAGIAGKVVRELGKRFGSEPGDLHAAIGPGIGVCCYQVGQEVAERFRSLFPEGLIEDKGSPRLDLMEANRRILIAAGLNKWQIYGGGPCTCCCAEDFYSFRRQGNQAGRMISYIGLR